MYNTALHSIISAHSIFEPQVTTFSEGRHRALTLANMPIFTLHHSWPVNGCPLLPKGSRFIIQASPPGALVSQQVFGLSRLSVCVVLFRVPRSIF